MDEVILLIYSQFPLWDFFECNKHLRLQHMFEILPDRVSQFPLWDFFECNAMRAGWVSNTTHTSHSQFPLWDFFECNPSDRMTSAMFVRMVSQFPLWDFFECNLKKNRYADNCKTKPLSIPFVGFLRMQQEGDPVRILVFRNFSQFPLWDFFECNRA